MTQEEILAQVKYHSELRGLSKRTGQEYCGDIKRFQRHFDKSADLLDVPDIQAFLHYLSKERNNAPISVNRMHSSLRFVYNIVLDRPLNTDKIPVQRYYRRLPVILSREEVAALIESCKSPAAISETKPCSQPPTARGFGPVNWRRFESQTLTAPICKSTFAMAKGERTAMPCYLKLIWRFFVSIGWPAAPGSICF